jgi:hypothetical protein
LAGKMNSFMVNYAVKRLREEIHNPASLYAIWLEMKSPQFVPYIEKCEDWEKDLGQILDM